MPYTAAVAMTLSVLVTQEGDGNDAFIFGFIFGN
jgi:hypothetical protein